MSDTSRLGISITARDTATASVRQLQNTLRALQDQLAAVQRAASGPGEALSASAQRTINTLNNEIAAVQRLIAAQMEQAAAVRQVTAAVNEQTAAYGRNSRASSMSSSALLQRESRHIVGLFDSLARGQRGQAMSSIGAAARDAGLGIGGLSASLAGLVALMGTGALIRGAESMGKWATETRAAASAVGMGIESYSALQGALTLTGMKANEADTTLRRFAINLSTALADPASKAAQAFHNLSVSQEQLQKTGGDTGAALNLMADAFIHTADGANKSANMNEIFGRDFEKIILALQNGSAALLELESRAKQLGLTLTDETAQGLERTGDSARTLGEHIRGDAIKAFEDWEGPIRLIIALLQELSSEVGLVVGAMGKLTTTFFSAFSNPFESYPDYVKRMRGEMLKRGINIPGGGPASGQAVPPGGDISGGATGRMPVPPLASASTKGEATVLEIMRRQMAQASLSASQNQPNAQSAREAEAQAEIAVMQKVLATATLTNKQREQLEEELASKQVALRNMQLSEETSAAKQSYADFAAAEKLKVTEAEGSVAKIVAVYNEWLSASESRYKQSAAVIAGIEREKVQAINAARLQEIKDSVRDEQQQSRLNGLNAQLASMAAGTYNYSGSRDSQSDLQSQSKGALAQAAQVKAAADIEIAALTAVKNAAEEGSGTQKQAAQEILNVELSAKQQEIDLYKKAGEAAQQAAEKAIEGFQKFFDEVGSGFESFTSSALKALIAPQTTLIKAGLTTIKESMRGSELKSAFTSLLTSVAEDFAKSLESAIGSTIAKALSGGAADTIGQLLSQTFSKALSSITGGALGSAAGSAVGGAAGNATVSTAIAAASTTNAATISAAIATSTTAIVSAIETSTAIGKAIPGFAQGGIVPSAAGGMVVGGVGGVLSILHPKEMVLPAQISQGIQNMIAGGTGSGGGNSASVNYSPTINSGSRGRDGTGMTRSEFIQTLSQHSRSLSGEMRNMMRNGWRPTW